jgi:uncharacterized protein (TIGR03000 family)
MIRNMLSYGGTLLLVGATVVSMPGTSLAQRGGGGHGGGGGHFGGGGAHFGGGHFGGSHFSGGRVGGYSGGYHGGGYSHGYSGYGGYRHGYYGYYPYSDYYPDTYDPYSYDSLSPNYDSGYSSFYSGPYGDDTDLAAPATTAPDTRVHVSIRVPADARVWVDGEPTTSTGPVRQFESPPLPYGGEYNYEVRARWGDSGHEVTQTRQVEVTPGAHVEVDFPSPPASAEKAR